MTRFLEFTGVSLLLILIGLILSIWFYQKNKNNKHRTGPIGFNFEAMLAYIIFFAFAFPAFGILIGKF